MSLTWPWHGLQAIQSSSLSVQRSLSRWCRIWAQKVALEFFSPCTGHPRTWSDPSPALCHLRKPLLTQWQRSQALLHHDGFKPAWAKGLISQWQKKPWHIFSGEMAGYSVLKHMGLCTFFLPSTAQIAALSPETLLWTSHKPPLHFWIAEYGCRK